MPEATIHVRDVDLCVTIEGSGPAVVLLHGFPHTKAVWDPIIPALAAHHTVIAPDLRGLGASSRPADGFTAGDVAADTVALLDALEIERAAVVGIDLGTPAAFLVGIDHPERTSSLVLMEALVGALPGADDFLAAGPPWWFGFHAVPGLAEQVVAGNEAVYLDFFLQSGTLGDGVQPEFLKAVHAAYRGTDALRAAFAHYRAFPASAAQIEEAVLRRRLTVPTLTVGADSVGQATYRQMEPLGDDVSGIILENAGHIIPQHRPDPLAATLLEFLR